MIRSDNTKVPVCPEQQMITTPQGNLSFRAAGKEEAILFLHGILGSSKAWAFKFAGLSRITACWHGMHQVIATLPWLQEVV